MSAVTQRRGFVRTLSVLVRNLGGMCGKLPAMLRNQVLRVDKVSACVQVESLFSD